MRSMSRIIYDPETGSYIDAETGEVLDQELIGGLRAVKTEADKIHWNRVDGWVHDNGLYTTIDYRVNSERLGSRRIEKIEYVKRLRRLQRKLRVAPGEYKLVELIQRTNTVCKKLGLPKHVSETACMLIKKYYGRLHKCSNQKYAKKIIALAIMASARIHKYTLTVDEVTRALGLRGNTSLVKTALTLGLKPTTQNTLLAVQDLWSRHLGEYAKYLATAVKMARILLEDPRITGISRKSLVGAIAYMVLKSVNERIRQRDIAERLGVTEISIRMTMKKIFDRHEVVVEVE